MKCPKCLARYDGAAICPECGYWQETECPQCGQAARPAAKFCDQCGSPLLTGRQNPAIDFSRPRSYTPKFLAEKILTSRVSVEGERKLVTVLFADVAGYTALTEKLDPEDVHSIMDGCFRLLMDEIHKFEGTINQFTGDGIMALFGAPIAHEDHARLACYAALSIRRALAEYGAKIKNQCGLEFRMRLGLNTGPVFVGSIGDDLRMDYTAIGDTTNLASRIQGQAQPGAICTSAHTHKLARNFFRFRNLGKIRVKGKEEPQEIFELLEIGNLRTRIEAAQARGLSKFVGRDREMRILREVLRHAASGSGRTVEIVGEPGAGKTRLILELKKTLNGAETLVLEGRCLHYGTSIAYLPILEILRGYFEIQDGEEEQRIHAKLAEKIRALHGDLERILPPLEELLAARTGNETYARLEPRQKRERIFTAIGDLLLKVSRDRLLILVFEDVHWIDKTSEDFLQFFRRRLAAASILVFILYRPEYTPPGGQKNETLQIRLEQLSNSASARLVQFILGTSRAGSEIGDLIAAKAAGNPLFTEELTLALVENGSIQKKGERFILVQPVGIEIPETVEGIIAARIDRLPEGLKRIMQVAAVIGREFAFRVLHGILEIKRELTANLLRLKKLEFIYEKNLFPESEYVFKHALTQEVAYRSLLLRKRKELHARIGAAIEELYAGRLEEFYERLAYHYSRSDELEKAFHYLKSSGKKAMKNHSNSEAFRFYKEAMRILRQMAPCDRNKEEQIDTILAMAVPMRLLGNPEESLLYLQEGERLCREIGDRQRAGSIYSFLGLFYATKGDPLLARRYQEESFREARKVDDIGIMAPVGYGLCFSYLVEGEFRKVIRTAPRIAAALERANREEEFFGSPGNLYSALQGHHGLALGAVGNFSKGEEACRRALSFARARRHVFSMGAAEFHYGILFTFKEDGAEVIRHMRNAIRYFEKSQSVYSLPTAWSMLGYGYFLRGDLKKALAFMQHGLRMQTDFGIPVFRSLHHLFLSWVMIELNDLPQAKTHAEAALEFSRSHNERYVEGMSLVQMGRILAGTENPDIPAAERYMRMGMETLTRLHLKPWVSLSHLFLGDLYARSGRKEKAVAHANSSVRMFQRMKGCVENYNRRNCLTRGSGGAGSPSARTEIGVGK